MRDQYCGYIILHRDDEDKYGTMVRLATIDVEYIRQQAINEHSDCGNEGYTFRGCHIRTDDGFCSTSYFVKEGPCEVWSLIQKHDREFEHAFRDYARRNGLTLIRGETW